MRHRRSRRLGSPTDPPPPDAADAGSARGVSVVPAEPKASRPPLWLALHLPLLPLEAWRATLPPEALVRPLVLVAEHRVSHLDARAAAAGIRAGMKRATALALAGDALLGAADARRDAAALHAVAHAALAFTPAVAWQGDDTVLLEVRSCLRLFGGLRALHRRLGAALAPLGHRVQMAAAPTALGAALLARELLPAHGSDSADSLVFAPHATQGPALHARLDAVPVWQLGPGREHWEALQGMGLHTLADLRALPREGLARRFGAGLLDELDRAYGTRADPRRWVQAPERFASRVELFARADSTDQVLAGAEVLLVRLLAWAQARQGRIAAFTLVMLHEPRHGATAEATPASELRIELAEPALELAHLQTLLRERLARSLLVAPTLELELRCHELVAGAPPNGELFPNRASAEQGLVRLLERLRARLGDAQVQRVQPLADHRPERARRAQPALVHEVRTSASLIGPPATPALPLHRPAWLLPEPLPLAERGALPLLQGEVLQLLSGPERIETGWWDGALATRDYFIALVPDGSLVWVWRERLPRPEAGARWFLQGRFG